MAGIFLSGKKNGVGDMTRGPLTRQMIVFAIPLIISGVLQLLFHTADMAVVGRFASYKAMAAVGATGSINHLLVNIFIGLSIGTNVMVARYLGAKSEQDISKTVHTSVLLALAGGVFLVLLGTAIARPILAEMDTPAEILDMSTLYMQIYFCGMPMSLLYNFGSAILRAMGDTTRPFYYLVAGGVINIALNLFFVIVCGMDVAGVAIATAVSQGVSAILIMRALMKIDGPCRVYWRKLRFCWKNLREILWVGIPAGFQSSCFSIYYCTGKCKKTKLTTRVDKYNF
jgi:putative MATE family efflux protein